MGDVRDYNLFYRTDGYDRPYAHVVVDDTTQTTYGDLPTIEEASAFLNETLDYVNITACFSGCSNMVAAPGISEHNLVAGKYNGTSVFKNCTSLLIPPRLYKFDVYETLNSYYMGCANMTQAAVIPSITGSMTELYSGCASLRSPVSIPPNVGIITRIYDNCTNMTGEFIVRRNKTTGISNVLRGTTKPLILYGEKSVCEAIAATANNGNASWSAWYDPVPAVTNRGKGSYTTAADMTRMVRNGALAVDTFAPGRMVYQQGDIVREDEWNAIVEAAQTIDPTVTYSTDYINLNKIEAAFDSAL